MKHKKPTSRSATKAAITLLLLATLFIFTGCSNYDDIKPFAYEHVKSLYMICNQKNTELLEKVVDKIALAHNDGQLSSQEAEWLEEITNDARNNDWQTATEKCRQLMEAQVKR